MAEFSPQEFLKSRGYGDSELKKVFKGSDTRPAEPTGPDILASKPSAKSEAPAPSGPSTYDRIVHGLEAATGNVPAGQTPRPEDLTTQQSAGKGVAKGLTNVGFQAEHLARGLVPGLGTLARAIVPQETRKRLRAFADEPSSGTAESVGEFGGEALPTAFIPFGKGAQLVEQGLSKVLPRAAAAPVFQQGVGFVGAQGPANLTKGGRAALKWGTRAAKVGERAGAGAAGGALADPEHPEQGAVAGAAAGLAAPLGGAPFRTTLARLAGQLGATEGAYYGAHKLTGLPFHPILGPAIVWHSSPVGKTLRRFGDAIVDQTGKIIGRINPAVAGNIAGRVGREGVNLGQSDFLNQMAQQYLPKSVQDYVLPGGASAMETAE